MSNRIEDMLPDAATAARAVLDELTARGVKYVVYSVVRTQPEQTAAWAQHRAPLVVVNVLRRAVGWRPLAECENKIGEEYATTKCDGVDELSSHQKKIALDVLPVNPATGWGYWPPVTDPKWRVIAGVFKRHGFEAGLDWPTPDAPHYTYKPKINP